MTTLAAPQTFATTKSAGSHAYAQLLAAEVRMKMASTFSLRNLGAVPFGGDLANRGSDVMRFRSLENLGASQLLWETGLGETGATTAKTWDVDHADVTVARVAIEMGQTVKRQALQIDGVSIQRMAALMAAGYEQTWMKLICDTAAAGTGTKAGSTTQTLSASDIEDVVNYYSALDTDMLGQVNIVLHAQQVAELMASLRSLPSLRDRISYEFFGLTVRPVGFVARIGNVMIWKSPHIASASNVYKGFAMATGGVGYAISSFGGVDFGNQRVQLVNAQGASIALLTTGTSTATTIKGEAFHGAALLEEEADLIVPIHTYAA